MYALSAIIDNVDNASMMMQLLEKQAANHVARNVPDQAYSVSTHNSKHSNKYHIHIR